MLLNALREDKQKLTKELSDKRFGEIIGACPSMLEVYRKLEKVAGTGATHGYRCYASCLAHFGAYPEALRVLQRAQVDQATGSTVPIAFYGNAAYDAAPASFDSIRAFAAFNAAASEASETPLP